MCVVIIRVRLWVIRVEFSSHLNNNTCNRVFFSPIKQSDFDDLHWRNMRYTCCWNFLQHGCELKSLN